MNRLKILLLLSTVLVATCVGIITITYAGSKSNPNVMLTVRPGKSDVILGEQLNIEVILNNDGNNNIVVPLGGIISSAGRLYIAKEGEEFRRYVTAGFSDIKGGKIVRPNESFKTEASILWNGKPNYSHLSFNAAERADNFDKRIRTDLAFPEPGVYLVKATIFYGETDDKGNPMGKANSIESEPIKVIVNEPVGENLEVWKQIKNNPELAFFIQHNRFSDNVKKEEEANRIMGIADQIITLHPKSVYSDPLKQSSDKFRVKKEKKQLFLEKISKQKQPN